MKRSLIVGTILILLSILDNALMPFIAIKGIYPSLLFVFIVSYSIINDKWEAVWIGIFAGMLQDLYFINAFGINALINMFVCLISAQIGVNIIKSKTLIPVMVSFALSILKGGLILIICYFIKIHIDYNMVLFNSIYNAVITILVYKLIYNFTRTKYMEKRWKF